MSEVKNTIPVLDICSLNGAGHRMEDIIASPFAAYLRVHPNLFRPHRHTFYHMVLFTQGNGSHTIDFQQFRVLPGQLYFMIPGQVHSWAFEGKVDGFVVNFSETLFRSFLAEEHYPERFPFWSGEASASVVQLPEQAREAAAGLLKQIVEEVAMAIPFGREKVCICLLDLFILVMRETGAGIIAEAGGHPNRLLLYNFRKLVNQYFTRYKLPRDYAALLYITPNHLNAICGEFLGQQAGEVIRSRILLEAKRLLVNGDKAISEIAWALGFTDNSYFTKFFRKYAGVTPEDFKRGLQGS